MNIYIIQHEAFESPGAILEWAEERSHVVSISRVYEFQALPDTVDDIDLLIVMGGPQSPDTTLEECSHFDASAEIALIRKAIRAGKAIVGVCLGAQLIGEAYDARSDRSPEKEIGVFPIRLTAEGMQDEKVAHFGEQFLVGHWHNDMPGLTPQSQVLAISPGCPRQIVRYGDRVYGFQCHMEFTPEVVDLLIAEEEDSLTRDTIHRFVQKPDEIRTHDFSEMNHKLFGFLDGLMS